MLEEASSLSRGRGPDRTGGCYRSWRDEVTTTPSPCQALNPNSPNQHGHWKKHPPDKSPGQHLLLAVVTVIVVVAVVSIITAIIVPYSSKHFPCSRHFSSVISFLEHLYRQILYNHYLLQMKKLSLKEVLLFTHSTNIFCVNHESHTIVAVKIRQKKSRTMQHIHSGGCLFT